MEWNHSLTKFRIGSMLFKRLFEVIVRFGFMPEQFACHRYCVFRQWKASWFSCFAPDGIAHLDLPAISNDRREIVLSDIVWNQMFFPPVEEKVVEAEQPFLEEIFVEESLRDYEHLQVSEEDTLSSALGIALVDEVSPTYVAMGESARSAVIYECVTQDLFYLGSQYIEHCLTDLVSQDFLTDTQAEQVNLKLAAAQVSSRVIDPGEMRKMDVYVLCRFLGSVIAHLGDDSYYVDVVFRRIVNTMSGGWGGYRQRTMKPITIPFQYCGSSQCAPVDVTLFERSIRFVAGTCEHQFGSSPCVIFDHVPPVSVDNKQNHDFQRFDDKDRWLVAQNHDKMDIGVLGWPEHYAACRRKNAEAVLNEYSQVSRIAFIVEYLTVGPPHRPVHTATMSADGISFARNGATRREAKSLVSTMWVDYLIEQEIFVLVCGCCRPA